jgi:hypothetical protein
VRKTYQNEEIDRSQPTVPETVSVALDELVTDMREGLLALAVGTGLQVMGAIMEEDVTAACGPKGRHDPERGDPAWPRRRVGEPGRAPGAGDPAADARRGRYG